MKMKERHDKENDFTETLYCPNIGVCPYASATSRAEKKRSFFRSLRTMAFPEKAFVTFLIRICY